MQAAAFNPRGNSLVDIDTRGRPRPAEEQEWIAWQWERYPRGFGEPRSEGPCWRPDHRPEPGYSIWESTDSGCGLPQIPSRVGVIAPAR